MLPKDLTSAVNRGKALTSYWREGRKKTVMSESVASACTSSSTFFLVVLWCKSTNR